MKFYLGTHRPTWLERVDFPLFVSRTTLPKHKLPRAVTDWAMDSGGFTELQRHGRWTVSPQQYAEEVYRARDEVGRLDWAAPQDWMCEPIVRNGGQAGPNRFAGTGLSVREHQRRTVDNLLELRSLAPDLPFVPVLQGWELDEYFQHVEDYADAGVDLTREAVVGVGSVCRRQDSAEIGSLFRQLRDADISCHGFGVKSLGLRKYADELTSADSLAWSSRARRIAAPLAGCVGHKNCANCLVFARQWRLQLLGGLACTAT